MEHAILIVLLALLVAGVFAFFTTPFAKQLAVKVGAIDVPKDSRRVHKKPTPRLGGIAIYYGFVLSVLCFARIDRSMQGMLIGSLIIVSLGIIDDSKALSAKLKFIVQIIAALVVVVYGGVKIEFFTNPFASAGGGSDVISLGWYAYPITVLWIVAITNAVNLIDGLDGLAVGVTAISALSLLVISYMMGEFQICIISAALAGGCLGFLPHNFNPAKIFMGDTGSNFLGFMMAILSVQGLFKGFAVISFAVPFLLLALPIFDTSYAIVRRLAAGKPIMQPDRGHLHHRLLDMGFSQRQTVLILYALSALLSAVAIIMTGSGAFRAMIIVLAVLIAVVVVARLWNGPFFAKKDNQNQENGEE